MSRRLSVLYVIDKLHRAGAQIHLLQLVRGLDRSSFAPRVCCLLKGGPVADEMRALGVEVEVLGLRTIYGSAAFRALPGLVRAIRAHATDLVHTYLVSANIYGTLAARLAGAPVLVTSRRDLGFSRNWRLRLVEEWLVNPRVDRVVAVSPSAAQAALGERGLDAHRVVTIQNGVDLVHYDPARASRAEARRRLGLADDDSAVGVVAHLSSPVKGHADLLEATARAAIRWPRLKLLVVGEGALRPALEAQARALGIEDRVSFTGARADMAEVLAALDLVVLPSHTEGMSNALLEAMAMARPIVATAVSGNRDVLEHGRNALLAPPHDPAALAEAMVRLLADGEEASRLGRAARAKAETDFGLDRMVARYQDLYQELAHA
ncbi:MAG TPA: glycosyltransferase [Vicinamibacteria bacterium]|nr:glycosyltransferase [Vicinamibacteria bacterium]